MANKEHLAILRQGVKVWNRWWQEHPGIRPDLSRADLSRADLGHDNLSDANLSFADLSRAILSRANLRCANLRFANLSFANLSGADLRHANLSDANLSDANLSTANLSTANLRCANLSHANLRCANLRFANLSDADLSDADLSDADLSGAHLYSTVFANVDLRSVKGLVEVGHDGPSIVQLHSVQLPQDGSAVHFLRGTGLPDEWIDFYRAAMMQPIMYHSCFISYSSQNEDFAKRLHADLQSNGVRCWFAPHDLRPGTVILRGIDEAIHMHDKLLLILSEHAVKSSWVEFEVEAAEHKEVSQNRLVLFPIRMDNTVFETATGWATRLRRRHIGDFTCWKDHDAYQKAFTRLLRDLKAEAQKMVP